MRKVEEIIALNKRINAAIADGRIDDASKWMLRLHKLEHRAGVPIGDYRIRKIKKSCSVVNTATQQL